MAVYKEHFINNQWEPGTGALFHSINSATGETLWQGYAANDEEIHLAVHSARHAFEGWSNLSFEERQKFMETFRDLLKESSDLVAETISKEAGKPLWESKTEVSTMLTKIDLTIEAFQQRCFPVTKEHPLGKSITRFRPHGAVAILGPFNFPGHVPHGHIIPALLSGNTVIFKPSEYTPLVGEILTQLWEKTKLPPGVYNMVQGGRETGRTLSSHPRIDGLFFTGSWSTGQILSEQFAKHPDKILALEMGGNNPLIVGKISDVKAAAYATIQSAYITAGQRCSCARRLIVPNSDQGNKFVEELVRMVSSLKIGPYTDQPEPFMGPVISVKTAAHLLVVQDTLTSKGGQPLVTMHLHQPDSALLSPGLIDVTKVEDRPDEEIFGPLLQLIRVNSFEEALVEANRTAYGLTSGLLSDDKEEYEEFRRKIHAGIINWNAPTTGANSAAPFGGIGHSGNYRPSGYFAVDYCCYPTASIEATQLKVPSTITPGIEM